MTVTLFDLYITDGHYCLSNRVSVSLIFLGFSFYVRIRRTFKYYFMSNCFDKGFLLFT